MFTVIFAEKETIKLFEETKMFFGPLYNLDKVAFCEWDKAAEDFDSMVPDLYDIIEYRDEWRALILYEDGLKQLNPFDYTNYSESFYSDEIRNWEYLNSRRKQRIAAYEKAVENPLVKLTTALIGVPGFNSLIPEDELSQLLSGDTYTYEYMLKRQLEEVNCAELAVRFDKYQRDSLKRFVSDEKIDLLVSYIRTADVSGINSLIPDTEILEFIRFIGNDPIFFDPEYTECLIENTKKHELLNRITGYFSMKDKLPLEVLCLSPRTFDFEKVEHNIKWKKKDELSASRFTNYNLYNDKVKFILFDILPNDNKQYKFDQIKFLCLILVLANNEVPQGVINANNVYRAQIDFNSEIVSRICENYISKLKATQLLLKDIETQVEYDNEASVDDHTAQRLFESDIDIPVKITGVYSENDLYAEYSGLGLSRDCPGDEYSYWSNQYRKISKAFVRYLREPRRAVKAALNGSFRENNYIDDDRSLVLSENQIEDGEFYLNEQEQKMIETTTTSLFNTKKYTEQLQEADKEIRRGISQRMTKSKTLTIGLIAVAAYFVGFLPLIFGNWNTDKSLMNSLLITVVVVSIFAVIGFVYLFRLRKKLVNRIKHFNYVMSGVCSQINNSLVAFSKYISSACNTMRAFSTLEKRDSAVSKTKKILAYHDIQISKQIKNLHEMFSKYIDFDKINIKDCKPYEFDFTILEEYEYDMPSIHSIKKIEFLQQGNEIIVPIDYVDSITITREELYD